MWWLIVILAFLAYIIWKIVVKPSITVGTDKTEYNTGETVTIQGIVDLAGSDEGQSVQTIITPPVGDDYILPSVTTDSSGSYITTFVIPGTADEGIYTVSVQTGTATASTTFTQTIG